MWISELSERTGIPLDTIKHYLRIGVLPKGEALGPQRAEYDESHVDRLKLIQAMTDSGGMKLETVRRVFDAVDSSQTTLRGAVGAAHYQLSRELLVSREPSEASLAVVDRVIARRGWEIDPRSAHRRALGVALDAVDHADGAVKVPGRSVEDLLDAYAQHLEELARFELGYVDTRSRDATIRSVIIGVVLYEPLLTLLRRLAQEQVSADWHAETDWIPADEQREP